MYSEYREPLEINSRHFTYCFNIFVIMQIFNLLNIKAFGNSLSVFKGVFRPPLFIGAVAIVSVV